MRDPAVHAARLAEAIWSVGILRVKVSARTLPLHSCKPDLGCRLLGSPYRCNSRRLDYSRLRHAASAAVPQPHCTKEVSALRLTHKSSTPRSLKSSSSSRKSRDKPAYQGLAASRTVPRRSSPSPQLKIRRVPGLCRRLLARAGIASRICPNWRDPETRHAIDGAVLGAERQLISG